MGYTSNTQPSDFEKLQSQVADLTDIITNLRAKRITQDQIIPGAVKGRHIGEGVPYVSSGLDAKRPTAKSPANGQQIYYATDTNKLYIYNGSAWKSVTLS